MFEFGRELKRFFQSDPPKDGLTGGDAALLELLELGLLRAEARAADVAAGRISAKDRPQRQLEAAVVWREVARRTGCVTALRKAAAIAEEAANSFDGEGRPLGWARARIEQARLALLGAALYGDEGLNAAAEFALVEVRKTPQAAAAEPFADLVRASIAARLVLADGDRERALGAAAEFDAPIAALRARGRRRASDRLLAAQGAVERADMLAGCGLRMKDPMLLRMALDGLAETLSGLDPAYEPLSWAAAARLRATTHAALGELEGDLGVIAEAVDTLVEVLDHLPRELSPLDWAQTQLALAGALQMMAEAADNDRAFDEAIAAYDRALTVLGAEPALADGPHAAYARAVCIARRAEACGDIVELAQAQAILRADLASSNPARDPVAWAVRQLNLARLYEASAAVSGRDRGERTAAAEALSAALEVFAEHGHRGLAASAEAGLERLKSLARKRR